LRPFAAPFVSTFATVPMLVDDQVITLKERINGCMRRSMNGKNLPEDGPEMEALIAYIKFLGTGRRRACAWPAWDFCLSPIRLWRLRWKGLRRSLRQLPQG
jgi:cytochrome c